MHGKMKNLSPKYIGAADSNLPPRQLAGFQFYCYTIPGVYTPG